MKKIIILSFLFFSIVTAQAQEKEGKSRFDYEGFKTKHATYLKQELNLTDAEVKNFIPLANEFLEKKFKLNISQRRESRALRENKSSTDADYQKAIDNYFETREKEIELEKEYYKKFKAVLPIQKIYRFERVERKFMESSVQEFRNRRSNQKK